MNKLQIFVVMCGIGIVTGVVIASAYIIFPLGGTPGQNEDMSGNSLQMTHKRTLRTHDIDRICRGVRKEQILKSPVICGEDIPVKEITVPNCLNHDIKDEGTDQPISSIKREADSLTGVFGRLQSHRSVKGSGSGGGSGSFGWRDGGGKASAVIRRFGGGCISRRRPSVQGKTSWYRREEYRTVYDSRLRDPFEYPLSTFSIDVDTASYSNIRRFISSSTLPPVDAVRIEEMINYFSYDYPQPDGLHPLSVSTELSECPWNNTHLLAHIGIKGAESDKKSLPPGNIVFLIDVSGSMRSPKKLPLLKSSFHMLIDQLRPVDRVAIVTYRNTARKVLASTSGRYRNRIRCAVDRLQPRGSTAGEYGLRLAYQTASEHFSAAGNNRIILATDGDFNVGATADDKLVKLIEKERKRGIFLTILGFGTGNIKDAKLEKIADRGNGHYAYIDSVQEGKKVLVNELSATLLAIARDVKVQVEFNPLKVSSYRLIGYENRILAKEDFNDDRKDAGELGAGHTVTALYEIIPRGRNSGHAGVDPLKYQYSGEPGYIPADYTECAGCTQEAYTSNEIMNVKLRYKDPRACRSRRIVKAVPDTVSDFRRSSDNFRFSAAVAGLGLVLRNSEYRGSITYTDIVSIAQGAKGEDPHGRRREFIHCAKQCQLIARSAGKISEHGMSSAHAGVYPGCTHSRPVERTYDWGVIYYMSYDNDLEPAGKIVINRIRREIRSGNTIAALQADFTDAGGMHRYVIRDSGVYHSRITCDESADEDQLIQYITWFTSTYACRRYMIMLLNHGDGVDRMCRDDRSLKPGKQWMSGRVLGEKLRTVAKKMNGTLELLFLQQCGRGSLTNLYSFRDTAKYIMFSSRRIGSPNTYYTYLHNYLALHPKAPGSSVAEIIAGNDSDYIVYGCVKGKKLSELASRLHTVLTPFINSRTSLNVPLLPAVYTADNGETFADVNSFLYGSAQANSINQNSIQRFTEWLEHELLTGVWFSRHAGPAIRKHCGISIYVPEGFSDIKQYTGMDLYKACRLDDFWLKTLVVGRQQ